MTSGSSEAAGGPAAAPGRPVDALAVVPALVAGTVTHTRSVERDDHFRYAGLHWLVDLDALPVVRLRRTRYDLHPADHLRGNGFRDDLDAVLAGAGRPSTAGCRVLLLAQPRVGGRVFDPLSVFWVLGADGRCRDVVLEVHNTYGERHAYVLPGEQPRQRVDKDFYVSPFNDVSGEYRISWRLDAERVVVTVNLHRDDRLVFAATLAGPLQPLDTAGMRAAVRRVPGGSRRVPALIRWRGVRLWLRRLAVQPRPPDGGNLRAGAGDLSRAAGSRGRAGAR